MEYNEEALNELDKYSTELNSLFGQSPPDEESLVQILTITTNEERQIIRGFYKESFGHDIQSDIKSSSLTKKLKTLCLDMFDTPPEYDARTLYDAIHSFITDENAIIEIFASRPKKHLDLVDLAYEKFFGKSLRNELEEKKDDFFDYLLCMMDNERPIEQTITGNEAYSYAKNCGEGGVKNYGKNAEEFKDVFVNKSREDLILIARAFYEYNGKNLYDEIDDKLSGKIKELLEGILFAVITPAEWFANKIHKALRGVVDEKELNRAIISRCDLDMYAIRDYYLMLFNQDLKTAIEGNTSGSYGQVLENLAQR